MVKLKKIQRKAGISLEKQRLFKMGMLEKNFLVKALCDAQKSSEPETSGKVQEIIAGLGSVPEIVEYLKKNTAYVDVLDTLEEEQIHRGNIEKVLIQSLYHDYTKLYRFCGQKQRRY